MKQQTHITLIGKTNVGKSTLINRLIGQQVAITSEIAGTTTDPVRKSMEISGVGACTLVDTAGVDDASPLGTQRMAKSRAELERTDLVLYVLTPEEVPEPRWISQITELEVPCIVVVNKCDTVDEEGTRSTVDFPYVWVSAMTGEGIETLRKQIAVTLTDSVADNVKTITGDLAHRGDSVLLVMPQDESAPTGRLILPQVQTIRELLDKGCIITCTTPEELPNALTALAAAPHLIITDSQAFRTVHSLTPHESMLTSFSVLFAAYKGEPEFFLEGAKVLDRLTPTSRILIAEACAHAPKNEDIGRVKLPRLLRSKLGEEITIDIASGADFPHDLAPYDLIIHCGACMFTDTIVRRRISAARRQGIPMTNYGIAIAHLQGILKDVSVPQ